MITVHASSSRWRWDTRMEPAMGTILRSWRTTFRGRYRDRSEPPLAPMFARRPISA